VFSLGTEIIRRSIAGVLTAEVKQTWRVRLKTGEKKNIKHDERIEGIMDVYDKSNDLYKSL
jgi:hypothetical protein